MKNNPITFVSFCVDIGRENLPKTSSIRREFELYKQGLRENLDTKIPFVVFTSVEDVNLPAHRNNDNLRYNIFKTENIKEEFPNFEKYEEYYPKSRKDEISTLLFYYAPLVVLKLKKIVDVINDNPFDSDMFFWMDCYFSRGMMSQEFLHNQESYIEMCQNVSKKIKNKFLVFTYSNRPLGFIFGGSIEAINTVYKKYFEIFFEYLPEKILHEEDIFLIMKQKYPEFFEVVDLSSYSSYYKNGASDYLTKNGDL